MKPLPYSREEEEWMEHIIIIHPLAAIVFSMVIALILTGIAVLSNLL